MILASKIRIEPTEAQALVFRKACGTARYTYNWALDKWKEMKSQGVSSVKRNDLKKLWNQEKPEWVYEAPKDANQQPFTNLYTALGNYFEKRSIFPKYKKKGKSNDSFYVCNDKARIEDLRIRLPLVGWVRMSERFVPGAKCKIQSYTISRKADEWFVSVSFEISDKDYCRKSGNGVIGLDLGLKAFVVDSNGGEFHSPKPLKKYQAKMKCLQRAHARKKRGSKNKRKSQAKVAKLHAKIANIRKDFLHKLSHKVCSQNRIIAIEDLNVKGMLKNHKLAFHISDAGWGEFRRQLGYKSKKFQSILTVVDRWFPSSKTCCECGNVKSELSLSEREYVCAACGAVNDRDHNAAINILARGILNLVPRASGEFTPMELAKLATRAIASMDADDEVPIRDNDSINESLGNQLLSMRAAC